jgi:hypothetical protein
MLFTSIVNSLLFAVCVSAVSVPSPVDLIRRAHTPGTVITKCAKPGVLALAFDDGPYTCMPQHYCLSWVMKIGLLIRPPDTSTLVDKLDAAGAKGTFFFTGTLYGTYSCEQKCDYI